LEDEGALALGDDGLVVRGQSEQVAEDHRHEVAEVELVVELRMACATLTFKKKKERDRI
jgi:hypothetical protein